MPKRGSTPAVRIVPYTGRPQAPAQAPRSPRTPPGWNAVREGPRGAHGTNRAPGTNGPPEPAAARQGTARETDGALALAVPAAPPLGGRPAPLRLVRPGERAAGGRAAGGRAGTELSAVAEATVRLVAEVLAGMRTPHHLVHQALPEVCRGLAVHRLPVSAGARIAPPQVLTTWLQEPVPGTAETGGVLVIDGRVLALALRLEHRRGRWRCTVVETTGPAHRRRTPRAARTR